MMKFDTVARTVSPKGVTDGVLVAPMTRQKYSVSAIYLPYAEYLTKIQEGAVKGVTWNSFGMNVSFKHSLQDLSKYKRQGIPAPTSLDEYLAVGPCFNSYMIANPVQWHCSLSVLFARKVSITAKHPILIVSFAVFRHEPFSDGELVRWKRRLKGDTLVEVSLKRVYHNMIAVSLGFPSEYNCDVYAGVSLPDCLSCLNGNIDFNAVTLQTAYCFKYETKRIDSLTPAEMERLIRWFGRQTTLSDSQNGDAIFALA